MSGIILRTVLLFIVGLFFTFLPSTGIPGNIVVFGPQSYLRSSGAPVTVSNAFTGLNSATTHTFQIYNGGLADGEFEKVSSSVISLNGVQIVWPNEFNQKVTLIEKPVTLSSTNQLSVELRGKPGGGITIQIIGVDNDPPTIAATVNPAPNVAGWHKSDVTVSFTCADAISGIAVCPSPLTVNAEGANQLVSGTATDRAGNTATTSVALNIDKTSPAVTIFAPADGATLSTSPVSITGAISEALSGIANVACNGTSAALSGATFTCDVALNNGANSIVFQATDIAGNVASSSITANLTAPDLRVTITSPSSGTVVNDFTVLVTGHLDNSLGEVGIIVNGYVALQDGSEFATFVPLDNTVTALTATVTNTAGTALASHTIPVTVQPPSAEPMLSFRPFPVIALVSQPVSFTLTSLNEIAQIQLDGNGDGTIDFAGTTLEGVTVTFAEPGLYFPNVSVTDASSSVFTDSAIIQVVDITQLDAILTAKWNSMKDALRSGDTAGAASFIVGDNRADYQNLFNNLTIPFSSIDQMLGNITYQMVKGLEIEYEMLMNDGPDGDVSYLVLFSLDVDGVWRVSFF